MLPILLTSGLLFTVGTAHADDIDVFGASADTTARPNVLFVLDYSGSMKDGVPDSSLKRYEVLEQALTQVIDLNASKINAGISVFRWITTGVLWPTVAPDALANTIDPSIPADSPLLGKDVINSIIDMQWAGSDTNTVSALAEAALYFKGGRVAHGGVNPVEYKRFKPRQWNTTVEEYTGGSHYAANPITYTPQNAYVEGVAGDGRGYCRDFSPYGGTNECAGFTTISCSYNGGWSGGGGESGGGSVSEHQRCKYIWPDSWTVPNYVSPIASECQSNFVVLISDGMPTTQWDYQELEDVLGHSPNACEDLSGSVFTDSGTRKGDCGPEIVKSLYENDQHPTIASSNVSTITIGFNIDGDGQRYLQRLADDGGGAYFNAQTPDDLTRALDESISRITGTNSSFSPLSVDINKATFSSDDRVFLPVFTPSTGQTWQGNLKGYFIGENGLRDINNQPATVQEGADTRFSDSAQSFWSAGVDGDDAAMGGASAKLPTATRNLYTFTGTPNNNNLKTVAGTYNLEAANLNLTETMLGATDATERNELLDWIRVQPMGDPLHSRVVTIKYPSQTVAYVMTNQGFLHAIDATAPTDPTASDTTGGNELFAFMPEELLGNLKSLRTNTPGGDHIYGLDGGITRVHEDANNNGIVDGSDTVQLVFGMRRGGNNYYALDVTDPDNPIYRWKISGGSVPFADLAQSWSRMSLVTVKKGGSAQRVLMFGGGYDATAVDEKTERTPGSGNSIFMVDTDGNKIWSASDSNMNYSIPSDLTVIDSDGDGFADRIYAGDVGGQIWRVDFDDVSVASQFTVTRLADFGDTGYQPFFYRPSVALSDSVYEAYWNIGIGSGNRTDPLDASSQNRIFSVKDTSVDKGPPETGFTSLNTASLYDATNNDLGSSNETTANSARALLSAKEGWYVTLDAGEKIMSRVVTFEGKLLATSFSPVNASAVPAGACAAPSTTGRYYALNLEDATPVSDLDTDVDTTPESTSGLTRSDRSKIISSKGIPSSPVILFPENSPNVQVVVDKTPVSELVQRLEILWWHER